jgi:Fic family protein
MLCSHLPNTKETKMPGHHIHRTWQHNPTLHAPVRYQRACGYDPFIPDALADLNLKIDAAVAGTISDAEGAIRALNTDAGPALKPLARLLLRTESIASSKVEGLHVGVRELAKAEAKTATGGMTSPTAREILGNIDAMILAVDHAAGAVHFGVPEIVAIHERLMAHAPNPKIAGVIRTQQNWIGGNDYNPCGADFVPPPPEEVSRLLDDLCEAINNERLPPLVQAAMVHAQFETIHPFVDGNGRTGRALVQVIFKRRKLAPDYLPPISVVLAKARDRYVEGLTAFRAEGVEAWIEQFADATARATWLADAYLKALRTLSEGWRTALDASPAAPRRDAAAWAILDILPAYPVITAPAAVKETGRNAMSVYQGIELLVAAGVLTPLSSSRRHMAWEVRGLLDLIDGLEAGEVPITE